MVLSASTTSQCGQQSTPWLCSTRHQWTRSGNLSGLFLKYKVKGDLNRQDQENVDDFPSLVVEYTVKVALNSETLRAALQVSSWRAPPSTSTVMLPRSRSSHRVGASCGTRQTPVGAAAYGSMGCVVQSDVAAYGDVFVTDHLNCGS
ncbi:hypothetical protein ACOMHN_058422 [Nucella lapillus]